MTVEEKEEWGDMGVHKFWWCGTFVLTCGFKDLDESRTRGAPTDKVLEKNEK